MAARAWFMMAMEARVCARACARVEAAAASTQRGWLALALSRSLASATHPSGNGSLLLTRRRLRGPCVRTQREPVVMWSCAMGLVGAHQLAPASSRDGPA